jgi:hypothetical protein
MKPQITSASASPIVSTSKSKEVKTDKVEKQSIKSSGSLSGSGYTGRKRGAPKGSRNAAKPGEDMRLELFFSKSRRFFLKDWYENQFGRTPTEEQLREAARNLAQNAINQIIMEDYERRHPELFKSGRSEVF